MLRDRWGRRFRLPPQMVGRTPRSARDARVPLPESRYQLLAGGQQADGGVGRGPGGPPHQALIADQNVVAAFDHVSGPAAVLVPVAQAVRFQVVDEDRGASLGGDPGIGPAAPGVNAGISDAQRGPAVHIHVGRPGFGGSDAFVRATRPMVRVLGHQGAIAEPGLFCHSTFSNISRGDRGQMPWR